MALTVIQKSCSVSDIHLAFLRRAVDLSRKSLDAGGFPVAAILVRDGEEISYGLSCTETTNDVTAHGEIQAIRRAGERAVAPLVLYSSLEPCLMCLAASAWAGVTEIVFCCDRASVDPSYYINRVGAEEASQILVKPPALRFIPAWQDEVLTLISQYQERITKR